MTNKKGFFVLISFLGFFFLLYPQALIGAPKSISIEAENADIVNVLKLIAEQGEVNLVLSKSVSGQVTLKLKDVPLTQALEAVLKSNNYLYSLENDIINVYSYAEVQQQSRFSGVNTKVYTLKHADVVDLRRALISMKSARGRIELNEKANQVIVTDTPDKIQEIDSAIEQLDQPEMIKKYSLLFASAADIKEKLLQVIPVEKGKIFVDERTNSLIVKTTPVVMKNISGLIEGWDVQGRQVLIEAKILQVTLDDSLKTGIEWQYDKGKYNLHGALAQDLTTGGIFQVGKLSRRSYEAVLEALEASSDTDVLSAPRIVVMNEKEANILVGSSEPYTVQQKDIDTGLITTETKFLDVGIKLNVTPSITEDGFVIMKIHPEVSSARRVAEVDNALAVDTTEANTTMMVKDGDTVILGGLIKDSRRKSVNKIPFLGDIPILGLAFRNSEDEKIKQEIIVFITPHIMHEGQHAVLQSEAKKIEELTKRNMMLRQCVDNQIQCKE